MLACSLSVASPTAPIPAQAPTPPLLAVPSFSGPPAAVRGPPSERASPGCDSFLDDAPPAAARPAPAPARAPATALATPTPSCPPLDLSAVAPLALGAAPWGGVAAVPGALAGRLRPYQVEGVRFLWDRYTQEDPNERGALLADDVGGVGAF